eukprot:jgi/Mesen1/4451/ME000227S03471
MLNPQGPAHEGAELPQREAGEAYLFGRKGAATNIPALLDEDSILKLCRITRPWFLHSLDEIHLSGHDVDEYVDTRGRGDILGAAGVDFPGGDEGPGGGAISGGGAQMPVVRKPMAGPGFRQLLSTAAEGSCTGVACGANSECVVFKRAAKCRCSSGYIAQGRRCVIRVVSASTLKQAIADAAPSDLIVVRGSFNVSSTVRIEKSVRLQAPSGTDVTIGFTGASPPPLTSYGMRVLGTSSLKVSFRGLTFDGFGIDRTLPGIYVVGKGRAKAGKGPQVSCTGVIMKRFRLIGQGAQADLTARGAALSANLGSRVSIFASTIRDNVALAGGALQSTGRSEMYLCKVAFLGNEADPAASPGDVPSRTHTWHTAPGPNFRLSCEPGKHPAGDGCFLSAGVWVGKLSGLVMLSPSSPAAVNGNITSYIVDDPTQLQACPPVAPKSPPPPPPPPRSLPSPAAISPAVPPSFSADTAGACAAANSPEGTNSCATAAIDDGSSTLSPPSSASSNGHASATARATTKHTGSLHLGSITLSPAPDPFPQPLSPPAGSFTGGAYTDPVVPTTTSSAGATNPVWKPASSPAAANKRASSILPAGNTSFARHASATASGTTKKPIPALPGFTHELSLREDTEAYTFASRRAGGSEALDRARTSAGVVSAFLLAWTSSECHLDRTASKPMDGMVQYAWEGAEALQQQGGD